MRLPPLRAIDWFAMIGMPVLCAAVLFFGLRAVIGPVPKIHPVQRIKDGDIQPGTPVGQVLATLGRPSRVASNPDGSTDVVYERTVADPELALEEGVVHVGVGGSVSSTEVRREAPPAPGGTGEPQQ